MSFGIALLLDRVGQHVKREAQPERVGRAARQRLVGDGGKRGDARRLLGAAFRAFLVALRARSVSVSLRESRAFRALGSVLLSGSLRGGSLGRGPLLRGSLLGFRLLLRGGVLGGFRGGRLLRRLLLHQPLCRLRGGSFLCLGALGGGGAVGSLLLLLPLRGGLERRPFRLGALGGGGALRLRASRGGGAVGRLLVGGSLGGGLGSLHGGCARRGFPLRRFLGSFAIRVAFALRGRGCGRGGSGSLRGGGVLRCALVGEGPGLRLRLVALVPLQLLHLLGALLRRRLLPRLLARHDLCRPGGDLRAALRVAALDAQQHGAHAAAAIVAGGVRLPPRSLRRRPRLDEGDLVAAVALHLARRGGRSARVAYSGAGRGKVDGQRGPVALAGAARHRSKR